MYKLILCYLLLPTLLISQDLIDLKGGRFRTDLDTKYRSIGVLGQHLKPILEVNPLAYAQFKHYKTGRIISVSGAGLMILGTAALVTAVATSEQTPCLICFFPDIDDNKVWLVGFGAVSLFTGPLITIGSGIFARIKLKKAVYIYNVGVMQELGLDNAQGPSLKIGMLTSNGIGLGFMVVF